jgi:hypothetical protein
LSLRKTRSHLLKRQRKDSAAVGAGIRQRRSPPIVNHALDGGAIELLQRAELDVTFHQQIAERQNA